MAYLVKRLLQVLPVLFLTSIPVFLVLHLAQGDPASLRLGVDQPRETIEAMRVRLGLDQPLWRQYWVWVRNTVRGDLGRSYFMDFAVRDLIVKFFPATFALAVTSIGMAVLLAVPLGILAALKRGTWADHAVTLLTSVAIAVPNFYLGILLILLFSLYLGWLPSGGYAPIQASALGHLQFIVLPAATLAFYIAASLIRVVRTSMLEVLHEDYIRTAHSKGVPFRAVIARHALRNALTPTITVIGVLFGRITAGTLIVEMIFAWPGLGQLVLTAIHNRDYTVVQGTLLVYIVVVAMANLVTDLLYQVVDPRISVAH